jgi:hypothetical protein
VNTGKRMRVLLATLFLALVNRGGGADAVVEMAPYRAVPYDVYLSARYDTTTETIAEIRVTEVKVGSSAEKLGVRRGDTLTTIDGVPVAGRKRSELVTQNKTIALRGQVTFTGHRGLFKKHWSVTIDSAQLRAKKPNTQAEPASTSPAADTQAAPAPSARPR